MGLALAGLLGGACAPKSETLSLFNGKDLEGWSFVVDGDVPAADVFSVEEGQILISGTPFGYMYTDAVYEDYDLEVEYAWVGKGTNSGIFLLIDETSCPFPRCVECNLQAGNAGTYVLLGGAGALEYVAPEDGVMPKFPKIVKREASSEKPDGEWNLARVEVRGGQVTSWINGVLQNQCTALTASGHIGLQSEGGPLKVRAVRLTPVARDGFTIRGMAPEGQEIAVLMYDTPSGELVRDTVKVVDGRYVFSGKVEDVVPGSILFPREGEKPQRIGIYVENAPLVVLGDHQVTGGPNNDFTQVLHAATDSLDRNAPDFREQLTRVMGECIAAHPDVEVAAFMYYIYNQDTPTEAYEEGFNRFTDKVKNSSLAQRAREELAARKATAPGVEAPDFTLNDPDGKPFALSSLRGQYVILDFWASWCKPCRNSIPGMKELYAKYHDKGVEILGVSDDSKEESWKKALEEEQMPWPQVIDEFPVKNKPARVGSLYGVHYIPSYFLLDKEGKIIGRFDHDGLAAELARLLD